MNNAIAIRLAEKLFFRAMATHARLDGWKHARLDAPLNTTSPPEAYPLTATWILFEISSPHEILNKLIANRAERLALNARLNH